MGLVRVFFNSSVFVYYIPFPPIFSPKHNPVNNENIKVNEFVMGTASDMSKVREHLSMKTILFSEIRLPDFPRV